MKIEKVIIIGDLPKNVIDSDVTIDHSVILGDLSFLESGFRIHRDNQGDIIVQYDKSLEIGKCVIEDSFWEKHKDVNDLETEMTESKIELLRCPFCGDLGLGVSNRCVECISCGANGPQPTYNNCNYEQQQADAIKSWNNRVKNEEKDK